MALTPSQMMLLTYCLNAYFNLRNLFRILTGIPRVHIIHLTIKVALWLASL